jgi:hypothetical protein
MIEIVGGKAGSWIDIGSRQLGRRWPFEGGGVPEVREGWAAGEVIGLTFNTSR